MQKLWHAFPIPDILIELKSSEGGLSSSEAQKRLEAYGRNALPEERARTILRIFLSQFRSPLIYILLAAAFTVFLMGERTDAYIIFAVLVLNAIVGAVQEGRAESTLGALKKFVETSATVLRDGREIIVKDAEVVPGDILILQEGEKIPADARVLESVSLKLDEASLTGESTPMHKTPEPMPVSELPTAEQKNMVFRGSHIVSGHGRALVVATGLSTVIGGVAREIAEIDSEIPLKANIRYLSRAIIAAVLLISLSIFLFGVTHGHGVKEMFVTVVSLSVSVIPEGLPIVITIILAAGVWRMSRRNALVKKLQAVEALGQARVIAVDKTGTLTKNEQVIRKVWTQGKEYEIGGVGYEPKGEASLGGQIVEASKEPDLLYMGKLAAYCASARVSYSEEEGRFRVSGDPTEAAMLVLGEKLGFSHDDLVRESPLVGEIAFDYKLKYHATAHKMGRKNFLTVVGAPEAVMPLCASETHFEELEAVVAKLSAQGLRVLAAAVQDDAETPLEAPEAPALRFAGFFAMQDALRPEVRESVGLAKAAGIRLVMITGDHMITARAIAEEAGIYAEGDEVLVGLDVDRLSVFELGERLERVSVFARVTPEHKLKIVNAYKQKGIVIAMTGDGVNDAPSLVAADLGVAMGKIGTEVAKEASDIVLLDDNFGSIVGAVEEGRSIYRTIKKVLLYLFSTSSGEVLTIAGALVLGLPLPLLAVQIIWLNFVTDGFLTVALGMEPKEKDLLSSRFEKPKKYIIDSLIVRRMFYMSLPMMLGSLYLFSQHLGSDMAKAWTVTLTALAVFQWFNAWNCRSEDKSIFQMNPLSNKFLVGATGLVIALQLLAVYHPTMQKLLHTTALSLAEWLSIVAVSLSIVVVEEVRKLLARTLTKYAY